MAALRNQDSDDINCLPKLYDTQRHLLKEALTCVKSGIIVIVKNIVSHVVWRLFVGASTSFIQVWIIAPGTLYCKVYLLALFVLV